MAAPGRCLRFAHAGLCGRRTSLAFAQPVRYCTLLLCTNNHVRLAFSLAAALQSFTQRTHESRRQESVCHGAQITARDRPKVGAGPDEVVRLGQYDPRTFAVEAETFLCRSGNLKGIGCVARRECVTGRTRTIGWRPSRNTTSTTAHGRSFTPSSQPLRASDSQR
jgi:hypothetical protein